MTSSPATRAATGNRLHSKSRAKIDPADYEVIRHRLWMINHEHGETIKRISGSPTANIAHDFNPGLHTEDGEEVFFGPYIQHLVAGSGNAIRWTLEHRSENPGITEGDIFLSNDPWISCNHQPDVVLIAPVFYKGAIFCWVSNALHQYDLGGIAAGSFCADAADVFAEPLPIPPIKIVEKGRIREDIEALYLRQSRLPNLVALDLRASIAGCVVAARRIVELLERFGAETVKAVMRKIVSDAEAAFLRRIQQIPDGTWTDVAYIEESAQSHRRAYKTVVSVTKQGDTLTFRNEGTAEQTGALNCTYVAFKGCIIAALLPVFGYDQLFAVGGMLRHCKFDPTPGTITCATWPAAVSCSPVYCLAHTIGQVHRLLVKMAFASDEVRSELSPGGMTSWPIAALSGHNQWGQQIGSILLDEVGGTIGAFPWRDGISVGGWDWMPLAYQPNIEHNEYFFPILYLYRKRLPNSGGAGKYRGGNSFASCFKMHGSSDVLLDVVAAGQGVPTGGGVAGGYPGSQNRCTLRHDSDVIDTWFREGKIPADIDDLAGERFPLPAHARFTEMTLADVYEQAPCSAAGYGDPLDREPDRVANDVANGEITPQVAVSTYGVVLGEDGLRLDPYATDQQRATQRVERAAGARLWKQDSVRPAGKPTALRPGLRIHEYISVGNGYELVCSKCGHIHCQTNDNYKLHCLYVDRPIMSAGPRMNDEKVFVDQAFVLRQYFCPGCTTLVATEVTESGSEPIWDVRLA